MVLNDDDVIDWDDENPPLMGDECPQGMFTQALITVVLFFRYVVLTVVHIPSVNVTMFTDLVMASVVSFLLVCICVIIYPFTSVFSHWLDDRNGILPVKQSPRCSP